MEMNLQGGDRRGVVSDRRPQDDGGSSSVVAGLRSMMGQLSAWRLHELETASSDEIRRVAPKTVRGLLDAAVTLFERVLQTTTVPEPRSQETELIVLDEAPDSFLDEVDRTVEAHSTTASADIAFIAKLEMQSLQRELGTITDDWDGWKIIELCERIRRHIVKATTALRRTLGEEVGLSLPRDEVYVTELVRSIKVRRRHATFRRQVLDAEQAHPEAPELRLRLVGTSIAMLICRREYRDFRIGDRVLIREIQREILTFLRSPYRSLRQAERIWQDVQGAMEITRQINRRPELLEHDYVILGSLANQLQRATEHDDLDHLLEESRAVIGRDEALDRLVAAGPPVDLTTWRATVTAAKEALEQHRAPECANEEILEASSRSGVYTCPAIPTIPA